MRTKLEVTLPPGSERVARVHERVGAQLDNLCGPYWVSILLRSAGYEVTQEEAAIAAGTLLSETPADPAAALPPGEPSREPTDPRIARTGDTSATGTSIPGMVAAASTLSEGAFALVPVRRRGGTTIDAEALERLVELLAERPSWMASLLVNLRTGLLVGTTLAPTDAFAHLDGSDAPTPAPEWDVGHFVDVAALIRGEARAMLLLRDSYPSFGWAGHHLQPVEAVAAAIRRDDGREGGCLVFVPAAHENEATTELARAGFELGVWDNGTPYEGGSR